VQILEKKREKKNVFFLAFMNNLLVLVFQSIRAKSTTRLYSAL